MGWLMMLGIAAVLIAVAAVLGMQPKGGRPVSRTKLMGAARLVLLIAGLALAYFALRFRGPS